MPGALRHARISGSLWYVGRCAPAASHAAIRRSPAACRQASRALEGIALESFTRMNQTTLAPVNFKSVRPCSFPCPERFSRNNRTLHFCAGKKLAVPPFRHCATVGEGLSWSTKAFHTQGPSTGVGSVGLTGGLYSEFAGTVGVHLGRLDQPGGLSIPSGVIPTPLPRFPKPQPHPVH